MPQSRLRTRGVFAACAILAFSLAALERWAVPNVLSSSTLAFVTIFMIGGATVSLFTWRNAQPTGTVAQLLHATEGAGAQGPIARVNARSKSQ
jgi:hypothetical protein